MKIHKQKGLTLIGFMIVLAFGLAIAFVGMKIGPIYMDNYSVSHAMNEIAEEPGAAKKSPRMIRYKFFTLMNLNAINHVRENNVKLVRSTGVRLQVKYEVREPIVGNLDVVVRFDKSVLLAN